MLIQEKRGVRFSRLIDDAASRRMCVVLSTVQQITMNIR